MPSIVTPAPLMLLIRRSPPPGAIGSAPCVRVYVPETDRSISLPLGWEPAGWVLICASADRRVTVPAGGLWMSAVLLTVKVVGTARSSSTSRDGRNRLLGLPPAPRRGRGDLAKRERSFWLLIMWFLGPKTRFRTARRAVP